MTSSTQPRYSVLADASFLTTPSNAQILQKQQLDAQASASGQKYLLIGGIVLAAVLLLRRR